VQALRLAGWRVRVAAKDEPIDELAVHSPDVIVVDVGRGSLSSTIEGIRGGPGTETTPLLAAIDPEDLRDGAMLKQITDFCVRPANKDELAARLRRMVNRPAVTQRGSHLAVGGLVIDQRGFAATLDGAALDLAYQEFQLLRFLVAHPDQAFSREQLLARVWGWDYYGGSRTVDIHVRRIRAKLGHPCAGWLQTIRHVGYRWSPDESVRQGSGRDIESGEGAGG
jgi:DNA-binding response OmpR family regulator